MSFINSLYENIKITDMKKSIYLVLGFITLFMIPFSAMAFELKKDGLIYEIDANGNATVTSPESKDIENCEIKSPLNYDGKNYSVTGIGKNAFNGCSDLTTVILPNTVVSIGEWAFFGCDKLESVTMSNTLKEIGNYAFSMCSMLSTINLPSSLTTIGRSAFSSSGLEEICIPESVTSIGSSAFSNCEKLASIQSNNSTFVSPNNCNAIIQGNKLLFGCKYTNNIPESVTSVGDNAFNGCSDLRDIDFLPNSITTIGEWAFCGCDKLGSIEKLPSNLKRIDAYAFSMCSNIKTINFPESLTSIGRSSFSSSGLTKIVIPKSVTSIGESAFASCESLNNIEVDVENTKYDSRESCKAIIQKNTGILIVGCNETTIPSDVREIGSNAFYGSSIESVKIPNSVTTIGEWAFFSCSKLQKVSLSDNLKYIDKYAFSMCSRLDFISFPASVQNIGDNAFSSCKRLQTIEAHMINPQGINKNVFEQSVYNNAKLKVPYGSLTNYKNVNYWNEFNNIEESTFTGIASPTIAALRMHSANGVIFIESTTGGNCNIFAVSGQLMRKVALKQGMNTIEGLSKGVYIVNGQKIMVR